jgi:hypothetical protein
VIDGAGVWAVSVGDDGDLDGINAAMESTTGLIASISQPYLQIKGHVPATPPPTFFLIGYG